MVCVNISQSFGVQPISLVCPDSRITHPYDIFASKTTSSCPIRADSQTTGLPVADNWIDEDERRWLKV